MHRLTCLVPIGVLLFGTAAFAQDAVFIESANTLDQYLSLQSLPVLLSMRSETEKTDGRIIWHPALDGERGILFASFESGLNPGHYLRRKGEKLTVENDDGTPQFAQDASFKVSFNSGGSLTLESIGHPGYFLRHRGAALLLEPSDRSARFKGDASYFRVPFDRR